MKAFASLLAVLLMLSCASLAQTAPAPPTTQAQPAADQSVKPEAAKPEAESQASPTTDAAPAVAATRFGPGAKVFVEPMDGFGELVTHELVKQKVPVVLVSEREKADFVMSGQAHLKTHGFLAANILWPHGEASVAIKDARTGNQVFLYDSHRVDSNERPGEVYAIWAGSCATRLKKAMKKMK